MDVWVEKVECPVAGTMKPNVVITDDQGWGGFPFTGNPWIQTPQGMGIPVYDPAYGRVPPQKKK